MAKNQEEETPPKEITLNLKDLQAMIAQAVAMASIEAGKSTSETLANAILESRKPYVDPRNEQNEEQMRQSSREQRKREIEQTKYSQDNCPHMQGSNALSDRRGDMSAIVMHKLDTGLVIGICTNCIKIFDARNPDHRKFFNMKSGNRMSASGSRFFSDPVARMDAGTVQTVGV
jgi:hypothetical protein